MRAPLAVGILTYNRLEKLKRTLGAVRQRTATPFSLVVADDGSSDGTAEFLEIEKVPRVRGRNMGVAWNKNRLLYLLANTLECEIILLLEDDCYPEQDGWEQDWIEAVRAHGHMNFAGPWFAEQFLGGAGTPADPVRCKSITGQCVGFSRQAIQRVGYFETRYRGYGLAHVEHSWRMVCAGFGGRMDPEDGHNPEYFLLKSDLHVDADQSHRDEQSVARNARLFGEIRDDGTHRWAWRTDQEMRQFLGEIDAAAATLPKADPPAAQRGPSGRETPPRVTPQCMAAGTPAVGRGPGLGIAITTYNRKSLVVDLVQRIRRLTASPFELIVCDDGSSDGTIEAMREIGADVIGGTNKGIAWNKNRGLFHLLHVRHCATVVLMDDDVVPLVHGWDLEWVEAARRYGHVNYLPPHLHHALAGGDLTAEAPGVATMVGGMIMAQTAAASALVGYMDPRFGRYGHEHTDLSRRFLRAGYGGFLYVTAQGRTHEMFYILGGGVRLLETASGGTAAERDSNAQLLMQVHRDPIWRLPWRTDDEAAEFRREMLAAAPQGVSFSEFSGAAYFEANPDVAQSGFDALRHYLEFGLREGRRIAPPAYRSGVA